MNPRRMPSDCWPAANAANMPIRNTSPTPPITPLTWSVVAATAGWRRQLQLEAIIEQSSDPWVRSSPRAGRCRARAWAGTGRRGRGRPVASWMTSASTPTTTARAATTIDTWPPTARAMPTATRATAVARTYAANRPPCASSSRPAVVPAVGSARCGRRGRASRVPGSRARRTTGRPPPRRRSCRPPGRHARRPRHRRRGPAPRDPRWWPPSPLRTRRCAHTTPVGARRPSRCARHARPSTPAGGTGWPTGRGQGSCRPRGATRRGPRRQPSAARPPRGGRRVRGR